MRVMREGEKELGPDTVQKQTGSIEAVATLQKRKEQREFIGGQHNRDRLRLQKGVFCYVVTAYTVEELSSNSNVKYNLTI